MNSIDTSAPTKVTASDVESSTKATDLTSDPAALEALRSLMGGIALPPATTWQSSPLLASTTTAPLLPQTPAQDSGALAALMAELEQAFAPSAKGGDPLSNPETVAKMQTLLVALEKAEGGTQPASTSATAAPVTTPSPLVSFTPATAATVPQREATTTTPAAAHDLMQSLNQIIATATPTLTTGTDSTLQTAKDLRAALATIFTAATAPETAAATPKPAPEVESTPTDEVAGLGNAILQSLGSQSSTAASGTAPAAGVATADRVEQVSSLMSQMADRVLVTDPVHGQNPEVRMKLSDSVMPGTEVRVWREDGQLRVSFDTTSPYWARVLNEASPMLSQRLNERLPEAVPAQVTVQQQQGGQPEDGRSRNRQNAWEMAQQAAEA